MKSSFFNSYFQFTKSQRSGIFIFLIGVVVFQFLYYWIDFKPTAKSDVRSKNQWMSTIVSKDSSTGYLKKSKPVLRPFNPNFITDFKGYQLGMSVAEIDRLLAYRKTNQYVNSAEEFQTVTGISDTLLDRIRSYFKFPDWVSKKQSYKTKFFSAEKRQTKPLIDINEATAEDLKKVYGIGDGLSERILKERKKFGGFVSIEQLDDVWGLSPDVIINLKESFTVRKMPTFHRINVNTATIKDLMQLPYFKYPLAKNIIVYRSMNGPFESFEDLTNISGFPVDRIKIIALYLEF